MVHYYHVEILLFSYVLLFQHFKSQLQDRIDEIIVIFIREKDKNVIRHKDVK